MELGFSGTYDLHLDVSIQEFMNLQRPPNPGIDPEESDPSGTVSGALHGLGLYLQGMKYSVDTLVIDRARIPAEN